MRRYLRVIVPIVVLAGAALGAKLIVEARPEPEKTQPQVPAPLVRVMEARAADHRFVLATQGTVAPRTESSLFAEVAGRVVWVSPNFASGGFFEQGDVLLRIDPTDYELAVTQARSAVAQARLALAREEAEAEVAREEWSDLSEGEPGALAGRELHVDQARSALEAAQAQLQQAERNLERARIRAPYEGRVRSKNADVGQYVTPGAPVGRIYAVDYAEIRLPVSADDLAYVDLPLNFDAGSNGTVGPRVSLHARFAGRNNTWTGRIVRVEGEIDPQTRMVYMVARVDDPYGAPVASSSPANEPAGMSRAGELGTATSSEDLPVPLAMGMFVKAEIEGRRVENVFELPREAMRDHDRIMIVDDENRLRFRDATILRRVDDRVYVGEGLEDGVLVCLSNLATAVDGMEVRTTRVERSEVLSSARSAGGTPASKANPSASSPSASSKAPAASSSRSTSPASESSRAGTGSTESGDASGSTDAGTSRDASGSTDAAGTSKSASGSTDAAGTSRNASGSTDAAGTSKNASGPTGAAGTSRKASGDQP